MNLSDFFESINKTKKNIILDEKSEKFYVPYVVNKSMSYHKDALYHSNILNSLPNLDNKMQYDYYLNSLQKGNRYAKWHKDDISQLELVMEFYGYSRAKAQIALEILSEEDLEAIKQGLYRGGKS